MGRNPVSVQAGSVGQAVGDPVIIVLSNQPGDRVYGTRGVDREGHRRPGSTETVRV